MIPRSSLTLGSNHLPDVPFPQSILYVELEFAHLWEYELIREMLLLADKML